MSASSKWVVLERTDWPSDLNYTVAFYANVPAARQTFFANPLATSQWKTIPAGDLTQLQSGAIVEMTDRISFPAGTPTATIVADLDGRQTDFQSLITARNLWDRYGTRRNADGTLTSTGAA
jgi:hypothetical protein